MHVAASHSCITFPCGDHGSAFHLLYFLFFCPSSSIICPWNCSCWFVVLLAFPLRSVMSAWPMCGMCSILIPHWPQQTSSPVSHRVLFSGSPGIIFFELSGQESRLFNQRDFVSANPFIVLSHCSVFLKIELLFGGHFSLEFSCPPIIFK